MANIFHIATDRGNIVGLQLYMNSCQLVGGLQGLQLYYKNLVFFNQHHVHEVQDSCFHYQHDAHVLQGHVFIIVYAHMQT